MPRFLLTDGRVDLKSLTLPELEAELAALGMERFRALQVYKWVWQRGITAFDQMTNVSRPARERLAEVYALSSLTPLTQLRSHDGTRKYLWQTVDGHRIESVLIPEGEAIRALGGDPATVIGRGIPRGVYEDDDEEGDVEGAGRARATLCVSTQVGCAMACSFCLTGDLGLKRHLRPSEIADQPLQVAATLPEGTRITNIVMMGMGEPLHNYDNLVAALQIYLDDHALGFSHRRVTVSTVGLVPAMKRLIDEVPVNLAVSLNATTETQRRQVMPITRKHSMADLLDACRALPLAHRKRITFEYVMMAGFNDSMEDAARLVHLLHGIRAKINLLPYNENPDRDIRRPDLARVRAFQHHLVSRGVQASVRTTRGIDISAACGQLGKTPLTIEPTPEVDTPTA